MMGQSSTVDWLSLQLSQDCHLPIRSMIFPLLLRSQRGLGLVVDQKKGVRPGTLMEESLVRVQLEEGVEKASIVRVRQEEERREEVE
jgi:hypothetical protein